MLRSLGTVGMVVMALGVVGCGGSSSSGGDANEGPRVEGQWRLVITTMNRKAEEERYTWKITPECASGPCSFRYESRTTGNRSRFKYDKALGDYISKTSYKNDCVNDATGAIVAENAYTVRSTRTLDVTDSVISDDDDIDYATVMSGTDVEEVQLTAEGDAAGCRANSPDYAIYAVRIDKPEGEPGSAAPRIGEPGQGIPPGE